MSKWYSVNCEVCGAEIHAHEDWERPPKYCPSCKAEKSAQWYEVACEDCGTTIKAHRDWKAPPRFCSACQASRSAKWYDVSCHSCGTTIHANRDWEHEPRYCPSCKAQKAAEWYERSCEVCGTSIRVHRDAAHPPRLCRPCKAKRDEEWRDAKCEACGGSFKVRRDWDNPPRYCKSCMAATPPKRVACKQCGNYFEVSTRTQLKCKVNRWELPRVCAQCKSDSLLIKGAVGALKGKIKGPLQTDIETVRPMMIFSDKRAVVRNKKTGEIVAHVTMDKRLGGIQRVAMASSPKGEKLSETHEGKAWKGGLDRTRVANTFDRAGSQTHQSHVETRDPFFPKRVVVTTPTGLGAGSGNTLTRLLRRGLFGRRAAVTDKEK